MGMREDTSEAETRMHVWEFPGGPVARTLCFHCYGLSLFPSQSGNEDLATKILQALARKAGLGGGNYL